ncbi:MAG TPA: hypothetical protein ENI87_06355, partial [bacterium]|nr:hypothetical protein [bacterium]
MTRSAPPRAARAIAARYVVPGDGRILAPGVIAWDAGGRVVSIRRARRQRIRNVAVMPGLVNAHAHLQLPALEPAERRFLPWVSAVMRSRAGQTAREQRRAAAEAMRELLGDGVTAVGEIDSTGQTPAATARTPLAGRCYRELTGFDLGRGAARRMVDERWPCEAGSMLPGLSPHAPYSVSGELLQAAARRTRHLAIHCAELPEEQEFLHTGGGPFRDLLARLGKLPDGHRAPGTGAVRWLQRLAVLGPRSLLVHCQELERGDAARIAAAGACVVVCPGTIEYFGRTPPDVPAWLARGIPVALGTDSRASNTALSLRQELTRAAVMWPTLSPTQLFAMATIHGGRALSGPFGRLRRGGRADLIAVPARDS